LERLLGLCHWLKSVNCDQWELCSLLFKYLQLSWNKGEVFNPQTIEAFLQFLSSLNQSGHIIPAQWGKLIVKFSKLYLIDTDHRCKNFMLPARFSKKIVEIEAQANLSAVLGQIDHWKSQIPSCQLEKLKEKVKIKFLPTNPIVFSGKDHVKLTLKLKNVSTLIVKVS
jgi:hypothetical protein